MGISLDTLFCTKVYRMNDERSLPHTQLSEVNRCIDVPNAVKGPLLNFTLSTVCPACNHPTIRRACKVRCERCGFMWDRSEL
jgi:hypothetical protein